MDQFETKVDGIPCLCEVGYYYPGTNYPITSTSLEPNDDPEFQFTLTDRQGYPAKWLEKKLTDEDNERIFLEFLEHIKEYAYDYACH